MRRLAAILLLPPLLALSACGGGSDASEGTGSLFVTIRDGAMRPVSNATVTTMPATKSLATDALGTALFANIRAGSYAVTGEHPTLGAARKPVVVASGAITELVLVLEPIADGGAPDGPARDGAADLLSGGDVARPEAAPEGGRGGSGGGGAGGGGAGGGGAGGGTGGAGGGGMGGAGSPPDAATPPRDGGPNRAPVAMVGPDQSVKVGDRVVLDASRSFDPDGDPLTFRWQFVSKPDGSAAALSSATTARPEFVADKQGTYVLSVAVSDGRLESATVTTRVVATSAALQVLEYRVSDADQSRALGVLALVSNAPNELHILDPVTRSDRKVDLPLASSSVSVSPDGRFAAVGHNAWISYVDLAEAKLIKTYPISIDVLDVVLAGNGHVYAMPRRDQWTRVFGIRLADGVEVQSSGRSIYAGTLAKLHPSGKFIYGANNGLSPSDIEKYDISQGVPSYLYDSPYHGDYPMCGNLWISRDGLRIFTRCGNVFRSSEERSEDMRYAGKLETVSLVQDLAHAEMAKRVFVIPTANRIFSSSPQPTQDTELKVVDYDFLGLKETLGLPPFPGGGQTYPAHGRFVFTTASADKVFVIVQASERSGFLKDFGVVTFSF